MGNIIVRLAAPAWLAFGALYYTVNNGLELWKHGTGVKAWSYIHISEPGGPLRRCGVRVVSSTVGVRGYLPIYIDI